MASPADQLWSRSPPVLFGMLITALLFVAACSGSEARDTMQAAEPTPTESPQQGAPTPAQPTATPPADITPPDSTPADAPASDTTPADTTPGPSIAGPTIRTSADLADINLVNRIAIAETLNELEILGEIATKECMRAAGFDYFPTVVDWIPGPLPTSPTREFVAVEGLGIAAPWASDYPKDPEPADTADQNQDYTRSLPPADLTRYLDVLGGSPVGRPATGCVGAGRINYDRFRTVWQELGSELHELETAFDADPRMEEIRSEWATCMSTAGYPILDIDEASSEIAFRRSEIFDAPRTGRIIVDRETGEELIRDGVIEIIVDEETGEMVTSDGRGRVIEGDGPDQVLLDALAADERRVALANFDCLAATEQAQFEIETEYRAAFLEENETAIDELIASVVPG